MVRVDVRRILVVAADDKVRVDSRDAQNFRVAKGRCSNLIPPILRQTRQLNDFREDRTSSVAIIPQHISEFFITPVRRKPTSQARAFGGNIYSC
jgi:hypothetical protein